MPFECKGVCATHKNIYITRNPLNIIGIDVYKCSICNLFVRIKNVIKNSLFKIKNRCACCNSKFDTKAKKKLCKCGCGELLPNRKNKNGVLDYKKGHAGSAKIPIESRKCATLNCSYVTKKFYRNNLNQNVCEYCYKKNKRLKKRIGSVLSIYYLSYGIIPI